MRRPRHERCPGLPAVVIPLCRYVHLSAGELLREERSSGSSDGQLIDEYIREGRIVPVAISLGLLRKAMEANGPHARFLIDGFPRNSDNVEARKKANRNFCTASVLLLLLLLWYLGWFVPSSKLHTEYMLREAAAAADPEACRSEYALVVV